MASLMYWWFEHMSNMLAACIAATTAFLVINAARLGLDTLGLVVCLTPTLIGVPATAIWVAYYDRKFNAVNARPARSASTSLAPGRSAS
jgi:hypothetical protein